MSIDVIPDIDLDNSALPLLEKPNLDEIQQQIVDHKQGALLVTGAAGSGKTTVLAEAIVEKIISGVKSDQIIIFCFSRDAARTMRKYLARRLPGYSIPHVSTFHSFTHSLMQSAYNQGLVVENYSFSPLRLLSGPEQEVAISELIRGTIEDNSIQWPSGLKTALLTQGFVRQVRNLLARMRALGMDPEQLIETGVNYENENWVALGHFAEMYLDNLDASETTDYGEIIHRANLLLLRLKDLSELNINYSHFFVDEYQDIDPAQNRLLKSLVKPNKFLLAVGDKEQSIYQFRGSDYLAIDRFKEDFENSSILQLINNHRLKNDIDIKINTFDSTNAQSFHIANEINRYKLENLDVKWSDILVVVRNTNSINYLIRALTSFAIPLNVETDDIPLAKEPAARVLLDTLNIAGQLAAGNDSPANSEVIRDLLKGPMISAPPFELRELARMLRKNAKNNNEQLLGTDQAIYQAVLNPKYLSEIPSDISQSVRRLGAIIHSAKDLIQNKTRIEVVLWNVWSAQISDKNKQLFNSVDSEHSWSKKLQENSFRGGIEGRKADADLDSVLALFDAAARDDERTLGTRGVLNFLSDLGMQNFQAETLAQKPMEDERVQIVTAHKSKGLEAKFVIIPDVQADIWPSARLRNNLLEVERLGYENVVRSPSRSEIIAEDIRLFWVARSRAKEKLLVSAIKSDFSDLGEPSPLLYKLFGKEIIHVFGFPKKPLSLNAIVAHIRKLSQKNGLTPEFVQALAKRLNKISVANDAFGRKVSFAADPSNWWATESVAKSPVAIAEENKPVILSGSGLATLRDCSLKWFLEKKAGANLGRQNSASIGSIIHALAHGLANGEIANSYGALKDNLDQVWPQLAYEADWIAERDYLEALETITNLLQWHDSRIDTKIVGSEVHFSFEQEVGEDSKVKLSGYIDRVEQDILDEKNIHIIDFKTGKYALPKKAVEIDPQLGVYRLAIQNKSLEIKLADDAQDSSAELVYLKHKSRNSIKSYPNLPIPESKILEVLKDAYEKVKNEEFSATISELCRTCKFIRMCPAHSEGKPVID
jgi:superfamily I DNA/RNA helicase/RecB family exonuclease